MTGFDYDLFIIGGGSGGVRAGRRVSRLGKRVGIAEEFRWGGTCVIRGCVPKKLMVYASQFSEAFEASKGFGWSVGETSFDWSTLISNKDREIDRLEGLYQKGLTDDTAEIFHSRAELAGPHEILLKSEDRIVTAEKILIAVGGTPSKEIVVPGGEHCITSDDVFHLEEFPKRIVIAGAGYIAIEFACIFAGLGSEVSLIYRGDQILRGFDHDVRENLQNQMIENGVKIYLNQVFEKIEKCDDGSLIGYTTEGEELQADQIMLAIGRNANTDGLGLENAGVDMDQRGFIPVDEYSRTNVPHILAVGDVTNRIALTPVAIHESMCLVETEFKNNPMRPDHELVATAVFSQPEIGTVGLTEEDAAKKYDELDVYRAEFRPMKNTLSGASDRMLMKVIVDGATQRIVGLHIMGHGAGELIQALGIAVKMGAKKEDFDRTMAVHPTAAEELVTMYSPTYRVIKGEKQSA